MVVFITIQEYMLLLDKKDFCVTFWLTWCSSCKFLTFFQKFNENNLNLITVNTGEP